MRSLFSRTYIIVGTAVLVAIAPRVTEAQVCSTSLTVNLTIELEPGSAGDQVLIELRQGHPVILNL
jgi:hypothetical protein